MKKRAIGMCFLILFMTLAASFAVDAQDTPEGEADYTPLVFGDNVFSLLYPSRWTYDATSASNGRFVFTSDPSILQREAGQPYAPGEITVSLNLLMTAEPVANDDGLDAVLTQFLDTLRYNPDAVGFSSTVANLLPAVEGTPAIARATYTIPGIGDGMAYLWRITDRWLGIVLVNTASGEIASQESDVLIFVQSVRLTVTPEELLALAQQEGNGS